MSEQVGANEICLNEVVPHSARRDHATNGMEPSVAFRTLNQASAIWHESLKTAIISRRFTGKVSRDDPGATSGESSLGQAALPLPRIHGFWPFVFFTIFHRF